MLEHETESPFIVSEVENKNQLFYTFSIAKAILLCKNLFCASDKNYAVFAIDANTNEWNPIFSTSKKYD